MRDRSLDTESIYSMSSVGEILVDISTHGSKRQNRVILPDVVSKVRRSSVDASNQLLQKRQRLNIRQIHAALETADGKHWIPPGRLLHSFLKPGLCIAMRALN